MTRLKNDTAHYNVCRCCWSYRGFNWPEWMASFQQQEGLFFTTSLDWKAVTKLAKAITMACPGRWQTNYQQCCNIWKSYLIHVFTGWWFQLFQPLWKIWKSVGIISPNIWKNKKCSKLPTSLAWRYEENARRPAVPRVRPFLSSEGRTVAAQPGQISQRKRIYGEIHDLWNYRHH